MIMLWTKAVSDDYGQYVFAALKERFKEYLSIKFMFTPFPGGGVISAKVNKTWFKRLAVEAERINRDIIKMSS